jgi:alkylation response protein AidB-like acyl-CoA dehydrogenase
MDFSLSDHQLLIRDTVRDFMRTEVRPHVKDWERTEHFPLEAIKKIAALGCCGMLTPEAYGGSALDTISYVLMLEEVAKVHVALSTALAVTNSAVQLPLQYFATEQQKQRYLKPLAAGEILGAFALTEPAAGSDAAGIQCTAVPCSGRPLDRSSESASAPSFSPAQAPDCHPEPAVAGEGPAFSSSPTRNPDPVAQAFRPEAFPRSNSPAPASARHSERSEESLFSSARHSPLATSHYLLTGTKTWVTNGSHAGVFLIFAKTDPAAAGKGITAFLVEPTFPGFQIGRHEDKMGQRSSPSVEIILNNCEVPAANRLGEEGQGLKIALSALDGGRIGIAAQAVGLAQAALDESIKFARARKAFGQSISEFQAIQFMLADMHTEIEAARLLLYNAASQKDRLSITSSTSFTSSISCPSASARAKLYASEMVNRVVYKAVQIHGSQGYSRESEVERLYRDARVISIYEGTSEIQRTIIARDLLRQ